MPILPPDRSTFGGESEGRDGGRRRRRLGGRGSGDDARDEREVTCTTCLQHVPAYETLMTERGTTCGSCLAEMESRPTARGAGPMVLVVAGACVVVAGLVAAVVYWLA